MLATHEELTRPRVLATVEDLGIQGASGVLEVTGNPSGAIYLDGGQITYARASWVPGLASRLRGVSHDPAGYQDPAARWGTDDAAVAADLVRRGCLTAAALRELIQSIVVDAFLVLTIPLSMDSHVTAIRFTSTQTYWTDLFPRLGIAPVRGEAVRKAERMAEYGLSPTTPVALRDLRLPAAVLTQQQWAVAARISGDASARELAPRCGMALADTVECLGGLIWASLCTPIRVTGRGRSLPEAPGPVSATGELTGLPARHAAAARPDGTGQLDRHRGPHQSPPAEILHRVLSGLRKLS